MTFRDISHALRILRSDPGFTAVVAVSIALGIAANTTVFSMVNGIMFGALPVRDPGGLYTLSSGSSFPYPDFLDYREGCRDLFESMAGHFPLAPGNLAGGGSPERVWGQLVTGNYFSTVGVPVALGRGIGPQEDELSRPNPVLVLSNGLWRRRFGSDPAIVGKTVMLNGRSYTVVGVAGPGFVGTDRGLVAEFWAPLSMRTDFVPDIVRSVESRTAYWITITGRLKAGVGREQALAALNVVNTRIHDTYRKESRKEPVTLVTAGGMPGIARFTGGLMALLTTVVGFVLLIACANVANLMLARAVGRQQEIGIRLALGAGRARLIRQLLTESIVLALLGGAGGFALAALAARALSSFQLPLPFPVALDFTPDHRVLLFTAALAVLTGIVFGLAPAIAASRTDLVSALKKAEAGFGRFRRFGLRNLLVAFQVMLSVVLLIGSGLFLRSLQHAGSIDLGIRPENVVLMAVDPKTNNYSEARLREFLRLLDQRITPLAGVRSMSAVDIMPLSLARNGDRFSAAGAETGKAASANVFAVAGRYFETIGLRLLRGRDFSAARDLGRGVAIVNQTLARQLFGDGDAIGRLIRSGHDKTYEVIGIAADSKSATVGEEKRGCAYLYLPNHLEQVTSLLGLTILVRTSGDPGAAVRPVKDQIEAIDRNLAVFNVNTLTHHVAKAFLMPRLCATLFGVFGLLGLVLASVGLYGVASYLVRSRTREIGIRMALGARTAGIVRLAVEQGLTLVLAGMAAGLAAAYGLSRFTASLLYGVSATDAVTFVAVPAVLLGTALIALVVPAWRAASVEPVTTLRFE